MLSLPVTKEDLKTLEVSTDGSTVTFRSDKDQISIPLYAPVHENMVGPASVRRGVLSLPMKKETASAWPSLTGEEEVSVAKIEQTTTKESSFPFCSCSWT